MNDWVEHSVSHTGQMLLNHSQQTYYPFIKIIGFIILLIRVHIRIFQRLAWSITLDSSSVDLTDLLGFWAYSIIINSKYHDWSKLCLAYHKLAPITLYL